VGLAVVPYDPTWPEAFQAIASRVEAALGALAVDVDHIGSTSVPGLAAKDCIDLQVRVTALDQASISGRFQAIGFRKRPETWNRIEMTAGVSWPKLVFASPVGERASNVHVREVTSASARQNLLFRDYLRANEAARDAWKDFKQHLALIAPDIYLYGQTKAGPTQILMLAAESWASAVGWTVP
jgi:dephospho-CoA kinase